MKEIRAWCTVEIMRRKNLRAWRKTCPIASLVTKIPRPTGL